MNKNKLEKLGMFGAGDMHYYAHPYDTAEIKEIFDALGVSYPASFVLPFKMETEKYIIECDAAMPNGDDSGDEALDADTFQRDIRVIFIPTNGKEFIDNFLE